MSFDTGGAGKIYNPHIKGPERKVVSTKPSKTVPSSTSSGEGLSSGGNDVEVVVRQVHESDYLGGFGVDFHEKDFERLKDFYSKLEENKTKVQDHIEAELKRVEAKLKNLFVLQEKLTDKSSEKKFDAVKDGDSDEDSVLYYGGEKDSDLKGSSSLSKILASSPGLQDNQGLNIAISFYKRKFKYMNDRAKSLTYSILSMISRYQNLSRVSEYLDDPKKQAENSEKFLESAIENKEEFTTIGPVENVSLTDK